MKNSEQQNNFWAKKAKSLSKLVIWIGKCSDEWSFKCYIEELLRIYIEVKRVLQSFHSCNGHVNNVFKMIPTTEDSVNCTHTGY